jgi:hypothetical protein
MTNAARPVFPNRWVPRQGRSIARSHEPERTNSISVLSGSRLWGVEASSHFPFCEREDLSGAPPPSCTQICQTSSQMRSRVVDKSLIEDNRLNKFVPIRMATPIQSIIITTLPPVSKGTSVFISSCSSALVRREFV